MATVFLKPGREARLQSGHLWIYAGEIARIDGPVDDGGIVDVRGYRGRWIGRGFINRKSSLTVRLLTHKLEDVGERFFRQRLTDAWEYRRRMLVATDACRVVYAEGDLLPGLIIDRYGDVVVLQTPALGMDVRKDMLVKYVDELLAPQAIYERNDSPVRALEGLPKRSGWLRGEQDTRVEIRDGPARFLVDIAAGQKTGFFLDQRDNRLAAAAFVKGKDVLDAFCYTGGFSALAALGGARSVLAVDSSEDAIALARRNAGLNGVDARCSFLVANAFDELRRQASDGPRFDVVILDPPAFAPRRNALERAGAGYKEINLRALKLLRPGGFLVSCSCSSHVTSELLARIISAAAVDAKREVRLVESRGHARDHPVHPAMPETRYLSCLIVEVR